MRGFDEREGDHCPVKKKGKRRWRFYLETHVGCTFWSHLNKKRKKATEKTKKRISRNVIKIRGIRRVWRPHSDGWSFLHSFILFIFLLLSPLCPPSVTRRGDVKKKSLLEIWRCSGSTNGEQHPAGRVAPEKGAGARLKARLLSLRAAP